jgi:tRNA(fMet)-specific endonuclease VapC
MKYLLDTNIISEPMKQQPNQNMMNRLALDSIFACTSATVWHELWHGIHLLPNGERRIDLESYLKQLKKDDFSILPFCHMSAEWLAKERVRLRKQGVTPAKYDSEIAAVATINQLTIVTRNVDDYSVFEGLHVENWFG